MKGFYDYKRGLVEETLDVRGYLLMLAFLTVMCFHFGSAHIFRDDKRHEELVVANNALVAKVEKMEIQMKAHDELNSQLIVRLGCLTLPYYNEHSANACRIESAEDDFGDYEAYVQAKLTEGK